MKTNCLIMIRETYEGVTTIPHFPTQIDYEGCHVEFEDLYFDNLDTLNERLVQLENTRRGTVVLDGGSRFGLTIAAENRGGIAISFRAHPVSFPGTLILEGRFVIDGEHAAQSLKAFRDLIVTGKLLRIEQQSTLET